jgi:molybdopterin-binding protein
LHAELIQVGLPDNIFRASGGIEMARFSGIVSHIKGLIVFKVSDLVLVNIGGALVTGISTLPIGSKVDVYVQPENVILSREPALTSARNVLNCRIKSLLYAESRCYVYLDCDFELIALLTKQSVEEMRLSEGERITSSFKATALRIAAEKQ